MEWVKEALSSMNADPMTMLGHCNQVKEKHTAGPKEA